MTTTTEPLPTPINMRDLARHVAWWDIAGGWKDTRRIPYTPAMWQAVRAKMVDRYPVDPFPEWPDKFTLVLGRPVVIVRPDTNIRAPLPPPKWPLENEIPMDLV